MAAKATLRLRLNFNAQTKGASRTLEGPARDGKGRFVKELEHFQNIIVEQVALKASDAIYQRVVGQLERSVVRDVQSEIDWAAALFTKYVIGAPGQQLGPEGSLSIAGYGANVLGGTRADLQAIGGVWAPRTPDYLKRLHARGHNRWFDATGRMGHLLGYGKFWTTDFGPVNVTFERTGVGAASLKQTPVLLPGRPSAGYESGGDIAKRSRPAGGEHVDRFTVGRLRVSALARITPQMLPSLATGNPADARHVDSRRTGLINLVADAAVRTRMAGREATPYRQTIEPFLSFVLTKAIPNAIARRLGSGLGPNAR